MHSSKQQQRGFNQVHELLQEFRQIHPHIPLLKIQRHKNTLPQAQLNRNQRIQNLHQAFDIKQDLTGLHIAIVDDVVTTGSTVNELAKICRNLGAKQVDIWCLMRANHD